MKKYGLLQILVLLLLCSTVAAGNRLTYWQHVADSLGVQRKYCLLPVALTRQNALFHSAYAEGAWALSAPVASYYGLIVTRDYDERRISDYAAEAALRYWVDLDRIWQGKVEKMLECYLKPLRDSTLNANAILLQLDRLNRSKSVETYFADSATWRVVHLQSEVPLSILCDALGVPEAAFRRNNPAIAAHTKMLKPEYALFLSPEDYSRFLLTEDQMYQKSGVASEVPATPLPVKSAQYVIYRVKSGDTLSHIAVRYHVTVAQLQKWNHLRSTDNISIGQKIKIYK